MTNHPRRLGRRKLRRQAEIDPAVLRRLAVAARRYAHLGRLDLTDLAVANRQNREPLL